MYGYYTDFGSPDYAFRHQANTRRLSEAKSLELGFHSTMIFELCLDFLAMISNTMATSGLFENTGLREVS